jgi:hypothetical protein
MNIVVLRVAFLNEYYSNQTGCFFMNTAVLRETSFMNTTVTTQAVLFYVLYSIVRGVFYMNIAVMREVVFL